MRFEEREIVKEYVDFFKNYYHIGDLGISLAITKNEKEWKKFSSWLIHWREILEKTLSNKEFLKKLVANGKIHLSRINYESHMEEEQSPNEAEETAGYFTLTNYLFLYITSESEQNKKLLMPTWEKIKDSKWFIILRGDCADVPRIFHELLHIIEIETGTPIYRGSSLKDEMRDYKEIIFPYAREFLKKKKKAEGWI